MEEDPCIDMNNPDWDSIKKLANVVDKKLKEYTCKKCSIKFISPRYIGKFPLCKKHRFKD
jgi:hypothetical protein